MCIVSERFSDYGNNAEQFIRTLVLSRENTFTTNEIVKVATEGGMDYDMAYPVVSRVVSSLWDDGVIAGNNGFFISNPCEVFA